jgi:NADH dehydrogenase [ubiquinone] 1 alpha subcomplex assembly factor 1
MSKSLILILFFFCMNAENHLIFDFSKTTNISSWRIVDDVVMGGRSNGNFMINKEGYGAFSGEISLKNNGGFSSLRYQFKAKDIAGFTKVVLRVKGDGKNFQFRIKDDITNYYSFIGMFSTDGNWQNIEILLSEMHPAFRGRKLNIGNFSSNKIEEIAFLIGNKKEEKFSLEIDKIYLK